MRPLPDGASYNCSDNTLPSHEKARRPGPSGGGTSHSCRKECSTCIAEGSGLLFLTGLANGVRFFAPSLSENQPMRAAGGKKSLFLWEIAQMGDDMSQSYAMYHCFYLIVFSAEVNCVALWSRRLHTSST